MKQKKVQVKNSKRILLSISLLVLLFNPVALSAVIYPNINADAAILVDVETGVIHYEYNIDDQLGIASITKLMSVYIVLEEMNEQEMSKDDVVVISERAAALKHQSPDTSGVWFYPGETATIEELINLSLIFSDNTAIIALAEHVSGSEEAHVVKMNEQAEEWGMTNTQFYNVTGLTTGDYGVIAIPGVSNDAYNVSSARDVSIMILNILNDYPEMLNITSKTSYEFRGETLISYNLMLPGLSHEYPGVQGLKTGTSLEAGSCFAGYVTINDRDYISVVLGAESTVERFNQTIKLYEWFKGQTLNEVGTGTVEVSISGSFGTGSETLHLKNSIYVLDDIDVNLLLVDIEYNEEYFSNGNLTTDIPAGETVATLTFKNLEESNEITTVYSTNGEIKIEVVNDNLIIYQGIIITFFKSLGGFYIDLMNSMFNLEMFHVEQVEEVVE